MHIIFYTNGKSYFCRKILQRACNNFTYKKNNNDTRQTEHFNRVSKRYLYITRVEDKFELRFFYISFVSRPFQTACGRPARPHNALVMLENIHLHLAIFSSFPVDVFTPRHILKFFSFLFLNNSQGNRRRKNSELLLRYADSIAGVDRDFDLENRFTIDSVLNG